MRVLAIRARNLASLPAGEIDLTKGALAETRIFVITGPTGAGKSTLLDALCLALYDRAPRLIGSREASTSELEVGPTDPRSLLRRGAVDGHAEVELYGRDGVRYRAIWEVWRSKRRSDGKLQAQKMRLIDVDHGQELTGATKTETLALIEDRVGLSFEEFRRAVLLAQGDFASFLRAKADDRAALLEKMTGSEIYAELSRAAYARAKEAHEALARLETEKSQLSVLKPPERAELEQRTQRLSAERAEHDGRQAELRRRLDWVQSLRALLSEEAAVEAELSALLSTWTANEPRRRALVEAEEAERLRPLLLERDRARSEREETTRRLEEARRALAEAEEAEERAEEEARDARTRAEEVRAERQALAPALEQALALDVRLEEARRAREESQVVLERRAAALRQAEAKREALALRTFTVEREQQSLARELQGSARASRLSAQWPRWEAELERHRGARAELIQLETQREAHARALAEAEAAHVSASERAAAAERAVEAAARGVEEARAELDDARRAHSAKEGQDALERLTRETASLEQLKLAAREVRRFLKQRDEERGLAQESLAAAAELKRTADAALDRAAWAEGERRALLEERARQELALSLAARRAELLPPGEACPLCGSLEHPYLHRPPPVAEQGALAAAEAERAEEARRATAEAQATRETAEAHERSGRAAETRAEDMEAKISDRKRDWERRLAALETVWLDSPLLARLGVQRTAMAIPADPTAPKAERELTRVLETFRAHREQVRQSLEREQSAAAALERAREGRDRAEAKRRALLPEIEAARTRLVSLGQALAGVEAGLPTSRGAMERAETALAQALGTEGDWVERLRDDGARFSRELAQEVELWLERDRRRHLLADEQQKLTHALSAAEEERRRAEDERTLGQRALEERSERAAALERERSAILGGRRVGEVEEELERARRDAEQALARAEQERVRTSEAALQWLERARGLGDEVETASARLAGREEELGRALAASSFADLTALERALAADPLALAAERALLAQEEERRTALLVTKKDRAERRQAHLAAAPPGLDAAQALPDLEARARAELEAGDGQGHRLLEQSAVLLGQLAMDDAARERLLTLVPRISEQRRRLDQWAEMSALIGSADGKKFRTFAQGLTLDALVEAANRHLRQLRPRYQLARVPGLDMELQIIDGDMGDEARAISTLSGGESFLVSLALALGLSAMSAKNVRIESLFIDEGFGSLDKESLETAISTLDQLQAEGRTIGLITHIPEVAERIGFQVQVRPTAPGRSEVIPP